MLIRNSPTISPPVTLAIARDHLGIEPAVRPSKRIALLEDGEPGEPGLVDLEHQPLEQRRVVAERDAVFVVMIGPVPEVAGSDIAVGDGHGYWCQSAGVRLGVAPAPVVGGGV